MFGFPLIEEIEDINIELKRSQSLRFPDFRRRKFLLSLLAAGILKPKQYGFRMSRVRTLTLLLLGAPVLITGQQGLPVAELAQQFKTSRVFWQQFEVAEKLVKSHHHSVLEQLEPYLKDEDRHVRGNAAFVFAGLGDDRGFEVIASILRDRSDRPEGQGMPDGTWTLPAQIASDRYYAAHLFGDLKDSRAVPILIPLLHDSEVNSIVPWSLGQIGDKSAVPPLIETLHDASPDMRVLAIYALEALKAKASLPQLRLLFNDEDKIHFDGLGTVAEAAKKAVAELQALP
jgi:HEAT repeats